MDPLHTSVDGDGCDRHRVAILRLWSDVHTDFKSSSGQVFELLVDESTRTRQCSKCPGQRKLHLIGFINSVQLR